MSSIKAWSNAPEAYLKEILTDENIIYMKKPHKLRGFNIV
jgi:hypothetical protein